jgi:hypothetical protein
VAETDILNPQRGFWPDIGDNPNPSYSSVRRSAANSTLAKARLGPPYSRETMNQGFAFEFNYVDRPWSSMLRLKQFYENFKGGYFTYIDWDGGCRHHVGRFTTPVNPQETANGKYTAQGLIFEEMPQARMLNYPANFAHWSRTINVVDDFLNPAVATFSASPGAWVTQLNPSLPAPLSTRPQDYEVYNAAPTAGDWAQIEYVGWGFSMKLHTGTGMNQVQLFIDGVYQHFLIDLSTGNRIADSSGYLPPLPAGMTCAGGNLINTNMPLDKHRVMIQATGEGAGLAFPAVTVIV